MLVDWMCYYIVMRGNLQNFINNRFLALILSRAIKYAKKHQKTF